MTDATQSPAFARPRREREADVLGLWVFLASEALLFGGAILTYVVMRSVHGPAFAAASKELSFPLGTINTAVLLTSSLTMALADAAAEATRGNRGRWLLYATAVLGVVFIAIKFTEYHEEIDKGLAPLLGISFRYAGPDPAGAAVFFNLYFVLTGFHAVHLATGIAIVVFTALTWTRTSAAGRLRRATAVGLYWHFVDVIWVFLYPLLYLINR